MYPQVVSEDCPGEPGGGPSFLYPFQVEADDTWVRFDRSDVLPALGSQLDGATTRWPEVTVPSDVEVWRGEPDDIVGIPTETAAAVVELDDRAGVDSVVLGPHHMVVVTGRQGGAFFVFDCVGPVYTDYIEEFAARYGYDTAVQALRAVVDDPELLRRPLT